MTDLQFTLASAIRSYVAASPLNRLKDIDGSPIFEEPLVGFAAGDDPLFVLYKTVVGEFHLSPWEALAQGSEAAGDAQPGTASVVSWILPVARETRLSNRPMTEGPSLRWNNTRFQGEDFNDSLRRYVVAWLGERDILALAPAIAPFFKTRTLANGAASNWSERHVAYAAGLGTFSLTDGLITARGIAHRCGSVVFAASITPTTRPYDDHRAYCSFAQDGSCGVCIDRCPAGAISPTGHDKLKCREYLNVGQASWLTKPGYIGHYAGCGLCLTGVPCEDGIP